MLSQFAEQLVKIELLNHKTLLIRIRVNDQGITDTLNKYSIHIVIRLTIA